MRRKIQLYIGGVLADLSDQSFILFNYTHEDAANPTAVKTAWSQQVTLPATPANDALFGHYRRVDRSTGDGTTGPGYTPLRRTPFAIYDETGAVLERGYCRLDAVNADGYKVSLFGGLGSFFYALAYNEDGTKRTLADLDYLLAGNKDTELDFIISANAVQNAWARMAARLPGTIEQIWDVINFAPAYNGIPAGDFSADRAVVNPLLLGLPDSIADGDDNYSVRSGLSLLKLTAPHNEWEVKDLRSYLQRPVLYMGAFLRALADPSNNGGFEFDYSGVPVGSYLNVWKTLPALPSLGSFKQMAATDIVLSWASSFTTNYQVTLYTPSYPTTTLQRVTLTERERIQFTMPASTPADGMFLSQLSNAISDSYLHTVIFVQLVALDSNSNIIGGSPVRCIAGQNLASPAELADWMRFTPWYGTEYEPNVDLQQVKYSGGGYCLNVAGLSAGAPGPASWKLMMHSYMFFTIGGNFDGSRADTGAQPSFYRGGNDYQSVSKKGVDGNLSELTTEPLNAIRSWARITKGMLLSGDYSPADYLIAFAKMHGLMFVYDKATAKVSLVARDAFYQSGNTIDLTKRVDLSKPVEITPMALASKWYDFKQAVAEGAFAKQYKSIYGVDYGIARVDTGYDFDAAAVDLLEGMPYRGAVSSLEFSRYFNTLVPGFGTEDEQYKPSVFLDAGQKQTLWKDGDNSAKEFDIPQVLELGAGDFSYFNTYFPGYDKRGSLKLQLHEEDGKPVDGTDILVYYNGMAQLPFFRLSDDTQVMLSLNEGKPCWDFTPGQEVGQSYPLFSRFYTNGNPAADFVTKILDFGNLRELDTPGTTFTQLTYTLYARAWRSYIRDRFDLNTKVMKCSLDLSGLQVGQALLRGFYYYGGSYWVINKIINHSLTTWDPTEVELVQVQNITNYTDGQSI